jgi:hypothetical protein
MEMGEISMSLKYPPEISSISDCEDLLNLFQKDYDENQKASFIFPVVKEKYSHGIWFRGEPFHEETALTPSVFRKPINHDYYNEQSLFNYARNRVPSFSGNDLNRDSLGLLSRMQHYEVPTRLLDWSESMLTALYFAVRDMDGKDGMLYCLNARKFNAITGMRGQEQFENIHDDTSYGLKFRIFMICCETAKDWISKVLGVSDFRWHDVKDLFEGFNPETEKIPKNALDFHCSPICVLPGYNTIRQQVQRTVFTLHGGKVYRDTMAPKNDKIPMPKGFLELAEEQPDKLFLLKFRIPHNVKKDLKLKLDRFGINEAAMFPDSDALGKSIREAFQ